MSTDAELLRRYAEMRTEADFAVLVRRHIDRIYSVALRQVGGDKHLAEDVVQSVFTALARKAPLLAHHQVLGGWLFRTTQFTAIDVVRAERRRRIREQEASMMDEHGSPPQNLEGWDKFQPLLDQTMAELPERDRDAVWLRFYEELSFAEIGARLSLTENGARMRVSRALDQLHVRLARRGVTSTAAALAAALAGQASLAAPAGLSAAVTGAAVAAVGTGSASIGLISFLMMNKLPLTIASVIAVAGATAAVVQNRTNEQLQNELLLLRGDRAQLPALHAENRRLAAAAAEAADLRQDDHELNRLREEAAALRQRLEPVTFAATSGGSVPADPARPTLDRLPRVSWQKAPEYPAEMKDAAISGVVVVQFFVDSAGTVQQPKVVHSSRADFETIALEAVAQWQFDAGMKGGRFVNTRMEVPIVFGTDGDAPEPVPAATGGSAVVRLVPFTVRPDESATTSSPPVVEPWL
jgi:RNA polymerase sigma factor (sigma-70 family)